MVTIASDKVLVDTSVWMEFFRGTEPTRSAVSALIEEGRVCCTGLILAELIQGAKSEKEVEVLRDFVHVFDFLSGGPELWERAGLLSFRLRRQGKTIGLADCYVAMGAAAAGVKVFTLDTHFSIMKDEAELKLYVPAGERG
jgi:predicted nucleic acid-binding protein